MTATFENSQAPVNGSRRSHNSSIEYDVVVRGRDARVTIPPNIKLEELSKIVADLERKHEVFVPTPRSFKDASGLSTVHFDDEELLDEFPPELSAKGAAGAESQPLEFQGRATVIDCDNVVVETCFARACRAAGYPIEAGITKVDQLSDISLRSLASKRNFKVVIKVFGHDDKRNHIQLVDVDTQNARVTVRPVAELREHAYVFSCTTMQEFFNRSNQWHDTSFYADTGVEGFGADLSSDPTSEAVANEQPRRQYRSAGTDGRGDRTASGGVDRQRPAPPPSVTHENASGGNSNVGGGVMRATRRVIPSKAVAIGQPVAKNYRTSNAVMFNNFGELFQDTISREYAQEIIEELFELWGVPLDQPEAVKYAEDMLWSFLISVTASNKADYNREFDIPVAPVQRNGVTVSSVSANFALFSQLLAAGKGLTRRQFARGVADDQREFLRREENQHILPTLATRIGCESLMAYLAFDGSTHCTNMTTREVTFTKTLESRNLFERDDVLAQGSSDRLMQGMSGGVRSVAPR